MTTYYVSSMIGSDANAGTSASAPLASLQAAADLTAPGDTVQVMNGAYFAPGFGDALNITTSGTASAPITFEAAPGQTPVIDSSGGWNAINIMASYIIVKGFTVVGDAANYNLQSALAGYGTGNADLDGNGIAINPSIGVPLPNHITIENNIVYNEPGGGIYTEGADYVQILNNVVHDNANWSAFGNSGISLSTSVNLDAEPGPHVIISGNIVYDNAQLVPTDGFGAITDGEGIILDTNPGYTGGILVQNNTIIGNGGPGIESFLTDNATIAGNIVHGNNTQNTQDPSNAGIFINRSDNNTVTPATESILFQNASGQASIWQMDGSTRAGGGAVTPNPGPAWKAIGTGDFDGDGGADILWQNPATGRVSVWTMDGNARIGGGAVTPVPGPAWTAVGIGDFNGDGLSDILWRNTSTGQAAIWEMDGNTKIGGGPVAAVPGPAWKAVGTGDFDGDGFSDILWQNTGTGQVSIWEMDGNARIGGGAVSAIPGPAWHAIGTSDFNSDGLSDILFQNANTGWVSIWEMDGNTKTGGGLVSANPGPAWQAIGTDGGSGILFQNGSGQTSIWEMDGNTRIGGGPVSPVPGPAWRAVGLA
jgi:parallel beta-helix repeat protein